MASAETAKGTQPLGFGSSAPRMEISATPLPERERMAGSSSVAVFRAFAVKSWSVRVPASLIAYSAISERMLLERARTSS